MALPPPMMSAAQSRSGAVAVRTTQVGLPVALRIDPRKLQGDPQALADEILRLSRLAAMRAQVEIRRQLVEQGTDPQVIRYAQLPTEDDLHDFEELNERAQDEQSGDGWLRPV
ncbi:DUF2694 family protein [Gordonia sp. L191]|uniref:DUF2694 family protein n=1 Tax=unclassified Gordonia (in: high G+C Gram-positive bacteria) TaxID=2657482 RepID=UPI0009AD1726|nr:MULTISPECIES: DUF2694 family protein [unclassified Gordonia (in: high G+C Gram-positive bacteria)]MDF3284292.1 DUF2694 family protein [Gordonia sp. N1V]OPX14238.1 hypothetical protein B1964_16125 [Gordonia sp. i37]WHU48580.1 DUF2694 family protein [Gordonia sp. L191]